MSMTMNIVGFKPPDERWKEMKRVWDSCMMAGVNMPEKVSDFFEGVILDNSGVRVELEEHVCCKKYSEMGQSGYEIDVTKLPKDIKIVRFYNSYNSR